MNKDPLQVQSQKRSKNTHQQRSGKTPQMKDQERQRPNEKIYTWPEKNEEGGNEGETRGRIPEGKPAREEPAKGNIDQQSNKSLILNGRTIKTQPLTSNSKTLREGEKV